ncbi:ATP-binding cassette domain-containing protein [Rothia sp. ZJ932]|uniref:ATP-binding cassette domain-containing protein n=1 Tax=Rothia sp. ZJ932 TaxID=2810516 RepID=UPI001F087886|nr:ABC transporter ATP-binding protein [Rothia sp. ZJ932]
MVNFSQPTIFSAHNLVRDLGPKNFRAVDHVSFKINAGQVLCLLGPNGAGKTTTINMCSTLLMPTSGSIQVAGVDAVAHPRQARQHIGLVLGGDRGFYSRATARDNLLFFADVLGVPRKLRKARVKEALEAVALTDRAGSKVQDFFRAE